MGELVVLVDREDRPLGVEDKLRAHQRGVLHRAVSVLVFDSRGRVLLQRRAASKYHSGGQWSNACCSHPRPGEAPEAAARRRLAEEMGMQCELEPAFRFVYEAEVGGGLHEHEFDHVFVGTSDALPLLDPAEADDWRHTDPAELLHDVRENPDRYTPWFRLLLGAVPPGSAADLTARLARHT